MNKINKIIIVTLIAIAIAATAFGNGNVNVTNPATRPVPVTTTGAVASGATQKSGSSGNVANASAAASLAAVSGKTNYITGFQCTASGSTAGLAVNVTVTGLIGGTATYSFVFPVGVLVAAQPLTVNFTQPLKASAANTAITVTLPAGGAGNTNAAVSVQGFDL